MEYTIKDRLQHAWNALVRKPAYSDSGRGTNYRPDRVRTRTSNERSMIIAIYNRIALDVASIPIRHVRLDKNENYLETISSGLNEALTTEANIDQTGRGLIQDVVMSMFDEGCVAIVPTDTTLDPTISGGYDIQTLRVGRIMEWYPSSVRVRLYNEQNGNTEEITLPKSIVAIIENPFYAVMNDHNSTLKRLIRKLNLLDAIDEQSGSGKLDLILQLPYVIKSAARKVEAEKRVKDIETQLTGSKYGIAYTDGTEKVIQLNRPVENNLMVQITFLTSMLYSQLGITEKVLDGTADEATMLNYYSRSIDPILTAICGETKRKFLTKTARTQNQSIGYYREPFKLVPVSVLAEIADMFTRNEILTSNEFRSVFGYKPSSDPRADELVNKNISKDTTPIAEIKTKKEDVKNEQKKI